MLQALRWAYCGATLPPQGAGTLARAAPHPHLYNGCQRSGLPCGTALPALAGISMPGGDGVELLLRGCAVAPHPFCPLSFASPVVLSVCPMDLPKLTPGHRYTLPRPPASADAALLAQMAARDKAEGRCTAIVTADAADAQEAVAVVLGIAFEKQNIAFMVSLAFAIAASANFPVLFMSVLWKDCTTKGAVIGGFLGLISAVVMTVLSKSVWVDVLGNKDAIFPYTSPALFSMTIGFVGIWIFSLLDRSANAQQERADFAAQLIRSETGIGAAGASGH